MVNKQTKMVRVHTCMFKAMGIYSASDRSHLLPVKQIIIKRCHSNFIWKDKKCNLYLYHFIAQLSLYEVIELYFHIPDMLEQQLFHQGLYIPERSLVFS